MSFPLPKCSGNGPKCPKFSGFNEGLRSEPECPKFPGLHEGPRHHQRGSGFAKGPKASQGAQKRTGGVQRDSPKGPKHPKGPKMSRGRPGMSQNQPLMSFSVSTMLILEILTIWRPRLAKKITIPVTITAG